LDNLQQLISFFYITNKIDINWPKAVGGWMDKQQIKSKKRNNGISVFSNFPNGKLSTLIIFEKFVIREPSGGRILGPDRDYIYIM